jgi:hypothetical protein
MRKARRRVKVKAFEGSLHHRWRQHRESGERTDSNCRRVLLIGVLQVQLLSPSPNALLQMEETAVHNRLLSEHQAKALDRPILKICNEKPINLTKNAVNCQISQRKGFFKD